MINSNKPHTLFEKDYLINLLKVVNFFDVVVVGGPVQDINTFGVTHICIALRTTMCLLDLVLNQVGSQLLKLNCLARSLLRSIEKID